MVHMFIVLQQSKSIHNNFTFLTKTTTTAIPTQPIAEERIAIADVFATKRFSGHDQFLSPNFEQIRDAQIIKGKHCTVLEPHC